MPNFWRKHHKEKNRVDGYKSSPGTIAINWILLGTALVPRQSLNNGLPGLGSKHQNVFCPFVLMRWGKTLINEPKLKLCVIELPSLPISLVLMTASFSKDHSWTNPVWTGSSGKFNFCLSRYPEKIPLAKDLSYHSEICIALITAMVACKCLLMTFTFL